MIMEGLAFWVKEIFMSFYLRKALKGLEQKLIWPKWLIKLTVDFGIEKIGARDVAQWLSACLALTRPWVQSSVLQKQIQMKGIEGKNSRDRGKVRRSQ
jgi:hypothetical protein